MPEIVSERQIASEGQSEGVVELQNFQQPVSLDDVQVAICQRSDVRC